ARAKVVGLSGGAARAQARTDRRRGRLPRGRAGTRVPPRPSAYQVSAGQVHIEVNVAVQATGRAPTVPRPWLGRELYFLADFLCDSRRGPGLAQQCLGGPPGLLAEAVRVDQHLGV